MEKKKRKKVLLIVLYIYLLGNCRCELEDKRAVEEADNHSDLFQAYDCSKPRNVKDIGFVNNPGCAHSSKVNKTRIVTYQVVQREEHHRVPGNICEMDRTEVVLYCGAYDHMTVLARESYYGLPMPISVAECKEWVSTGKWRDPSSGVVYPLQQNAVNIIQFERLGRTYPSGGEVKCEGQEMRSQGEILYNMVVQVQINIKLRNETILLGKNEVIAHVADKRLPCDVKDTGCATPEATYIWSAPLDPCELAYVRMIAGLEVANEEGDAVFMSTDGSLVRLLKKEAVSECQRIVYRTNYESIYLYDTGKEKKPFTRRVEAGEVSITTYVKNRDDFLFNHVANAVEEEFNRVLKNDCANRAQTIRAEFFMQHRDPGMTTWMQGEGTYSTTAGDVTYTYQCEGVVVRG